MQVKEQMAECLKEITLQSLWQSEISEEEEEYYSNDRFIPLNHMVRKCYLKHLRQVLTKNLNMCSDSSNIFTQHDIERCAGLLELKALRLSMVTSLYQKAMVRMVADIKQHTKELKLYDELKEFVPQNCSCKINKCKATQTNIFEIKVEDQGSIAENNINNVKIKIEYSDETEIQNFAADCVEMPCSSFPISSDGNFSGPCVPQDFIPIPVLDSTNQCTALENNDRCKDRSESVDFTNEFRISNGDDSKRIVQEKQNENLSECCTSNEPINVTCKNNNDISCNNIISSHSNSSNLERSTEEDETIKQLHMFLHDDTSNAEFGEAFLYDTATEELIRILESEDELIEEDKEDYKPAKDIKPLECTNTSVDSFWETEKQYQKKNLHEHISKMCCNPEAKIKMKNKFFELFGFDSDEDDVWCSKEKIAQYKQKIAPIVVKHLLPYYKQRRILGRQVFKRVASHITDKLVSISHFPEEGDIEKGITLFFSYHGFIGKLEDVWSGWDKALH